MRDSAVPVVNRRDCANGALQRFGSNAFKDTL